MCIELAHLSYYSLLWLSYSDFIVKIENLRSVSSCQMWLKHRELAYLKFRIAYSAVATRSTWLAFLNLNPP